VAQAANLSTTAISTGQFITLFGSGLGPQVGLIAQFTDGHYPVELGGTRVLVNGSPAPLLYAQSGQVNALVPAELQAGSTITVSIRYQGVLRGATTLPVSDYVPALFRRWTTREIVANHDDGTPVSASQPAKAGEIIRLYGTGFGGLSTTSVLTTVPVFSIGGGIAEVLFAGEPAEGPAGLMLFRVRVPEQLPGLDPIFVTFAEGVGFIYPPLTLPMGK
jgi:uncharacterized protein (TIGR03437 family)